MIYYIMGVSGSGKTTIGKLLATQLSIPFFDADNFHSSANIKKMSEGKPLDDNDRKDWLLAIHEKAVIELISGKGAVFACSALKENYRETISKGIEEKIKWVFLKGDFEVIKKRMESRAHFMPSSLLISQFETLEIPNYGMQISINNNPEEIIKIILETQ